MFGLLIPILLIVLVIGVSSMRKQQTENRFFSVSSITEKLSLLALRFPVSILLVVGFAVLWFIMIESDFAEFPFRLLLFFSIGAFISVSATLLAEDFFDKIKTYAITIFAVLPWGVYCLFLPETDDKFPIAKGIELAVICAAAFWSMFFISFLKRNKDCAFWNFTTQTLFQMALACVFGGILLGGLSIALLAIDGLFGVSIKGDVYAHLAVICLALFAPIYFLANIPDKTEKHRDEMFYSKAQKILALYIFTPILAVYAMILYAYLFKIIFAWELPVGWVSWLVSALAIGGLVVITFLFPVREETNNKVVNFISRWFGLLILPLLLLMTIGIFRRIGDYGITINRCYILLLNLWFYGIYIYLFLTDSKRIKWILISPIVLALFTSISFFGVATITRNVLTQEVGTVLHKQMSANEARAIFDEMTQEERERMKSALEYLHNNFGKESVQPFFRDSVPNSSWRFLEKMGLEDRTAVECLANEYFNIPVGNVGQILDIENYSAFTRINWYSSNRKTDTNFTKIRYSVENELLEVEIKSDKRIFSIPLKASILENLEDNTEEKRIITGADYMFVINIMRGNYADKDSVNVSYLEGYLFYKK